MAGFGAAALGLGIGVLLRQFLHLSVLDSILIILLVAVIAGAIWLVCKMVPRWPGWS